MQSMNPDMPPPPLAIWAELERRAVLLSESRFAMPAPYALSGNYRGVLHHLAEGGIGPGVNVVWPQGSVASARQQLERKLGPDGWLALATVVGSAASLYVPIAGLVAAAGNAGHQVAKWLAQDNMPDRPASLGMVFRELVKSVARDGPVFLVLDGVDAPDREILWHTAYFTLAAYELRGLQIVAGVDAPVDWAMSEDDASDGEWSSAVRSIRALATEGKVDVGSVLSLSETRVRKWLGQVDGDLVAQLLAESGSRDDVAAQIWKGWGDSGYVKKRPSGKWAASGQPEPALDGVHRVLDAVVPHAGMDLAFRILQVAAVSWPLFSGSALFQLIRDDLDVPVDTAEDLVDSLTPLAGSALPWLVETNGSVTDENGQSHWFYRFESENTRRHLASYFGEDEGRVLSSRLLDSAIASHGAPPEFLPTAEYLARRAGRDHEADTFASKMRTRWRLNSAGAVAAVLLDAAEAPNAPLFLCGMLDASAADLHGLGYNALAEKVATAAVDLARRYQSVPSLAVATMRLGIVLTFQSKVGAALPLLAETVELHRAIYRSQPTPANAHELGIGLHTLSEARRLRGDATTALPIAREAVEFHRTAFGALPRRSYQRGLAVALSGLGGLTALVHTEPEAVPDLSEAIDHQRELIRERPTTGDVRNLAVSVAQLGQIFQRAKNVDAAAPLFEEALALNRNLFENDPTPLHREGLAFSLGLLGRLVGHRDGGSRAVQLLTESVELHRVLMADEPNPEMRHSLALALARFGEVQSARGDTAAALAMLNESLAHMEALVAEYSTDWFARTLASTLEIAGQTHLLESNNSVALPLFRRSVGIRRDIHEREPTPSNRNDLRIGLHLLTVAYKLDGNAKGSAQALSESEALYEE